MMSTGTLISAILPLIVLLLVVLLDFTFRREVYNRADPLSFSLLFYSFLLILSDTLVSVTRQLVLNQINARLMVFVTSYLLVAILVFQFAKRAHANFVVEQQKRVRGFLDRIRTSDVSDSLWKSLEVLGTESVEPDVFQRNPYKQLRRIEFLHKVQQLTNLPIDPERDEAQLLVTNVRTRVLAELAYASTVVFALLSTVFFFYWR